MKDKESISKFLSYVLRHNPGSIYLTMDKNGWVEINELISHADKYKNIHLTDEILRDIVDTNDKKRFAVDEANNRIRASQGHSIDIDLGLESRVPPDILYHGTAGRFLDAILKDGLKAMSRQHVHLSKDEKTAVTVGKRHGKPVVLEILAGEMYKKDFVFYLSDNQVWLVDSVPREYIRVME